MKGLPLIIRYILIILLAVVIVTFAFLHIATSTILSKEYVLTKLEETGYYNGIHQEVEKNFRNYIDQSGLEEEVMNDVITEDKVKKDVNIIINNIYEGKEEEIDVTEIRTNLNNNIEKYVAGKTGLKTNSVAIKTYIDKICEQYKTTMAHTQYEQQIHNVYKEILQYVNLANIILLISGLVLVIIIFAICHSKIWKGISSVGIAMLSSGILLVAINLFVQAKVKINTITLLNSSISNSLRAILNNIMSTISNYGYIILGIGIVCILLGNLIDSKNKKEEEESN